MKLIYLIALFTCTHLLAQDHYHQYPTPTCPEKACLESDTTKIGMTEFEDIDGYVFERLNTRSTLTDVMLWDNYCFRGNEGDVCRIISSLAGNNEADYAQGGHTQVFSLQCHVDSNTLLVSYDEKSDYSQNLEPKVFKIPKCHQ